MIDQASTISKWRAQMFSYILTVTISTAIAQAPKNVEFSDIRKVAVETIKDKSYPKSSRVFSLSDKVLTYDNQPDNFAVKDDSEIDPYEGVLAILLLSEKVRQFGIPEMPEANTEEIARKIEGHAHKALEAINEGRVKGKDATKLTMDQFNEAMDYTISIAEKHSKKKKWAFAQKREIISVLIATDPKGGVIHAIPEFQQRLLVVRGKKPEIEVMQYRYTDSISFIGKVYYAITWDEGKRKVKPAFTDVVSKGDKPFIFK